MKSTTHRLFVIRHAKSSWSDLTLRDHDRPLNARGKRDLPIMADYVKKRHGLPDRWLVSSALRAQKTADGFLALWPAGQKITDPNLYLAYHETALDIIKEKAIEPEVAIVGHNPGWTDFVNSVPNASIDNVPTCGVAIIDCAIDSWNDLSWDAMTLRDFMYPKGIGLC